MAQSAPPPGSLSDPLLRWLAMILAVEGLTGLVYAILVGLYFIAGLVMVVTIAMIALVRAHLRRGRR